MILKTSDNINAVQRNQSNLYFSSGLTVIRSFLAFIFYFYNTSSIEIEQVFNSGRNCVFVFTATTLSASSAPATEKCPEASHSSTSMRWYVHTHTSTSTCISTCTVSCSPYLYHNLTLIPNITLKPSPFEEVRQNNLVFQKCPRKRSRIDTENSPSLHFYVFVSQNLLLRAELRAGLWTQASVIMLLGTILLEENNNIHWD